MQHLPNQIILQFNKPASEWIEIQLPLSKSIANRLLIISHLSNGKVKVNQWSDADDTVVLKHALHRTSGEVNIGHAGTAMRFLTAYYASNPGSEVLLTGSERMKERPVKTLVDALIELGADIRYYEKEGFPPLIIKGKKIIGGEIKIQSDVSSQFISALMMVAPTFRDGLKLITLGQRVSQPYIDLTASLMKQAGAEIYTDNQSIRVYPGSYQSNEILKVEADWSAAAFWFGISVLSKQKLRLIGLNENSPQGDSWLLNWFRTHGTNAHFDSQALFIDPANFNIPQEIIHLDLVNYPDLAQMFCVFFALLRKKFQITGLQTLPIKETNRIQAIMNELSPFDVIFSSYQPDCIQADATHVNFGKPHSISTYQDHRMAMAFSLIAFAGFKTTILNPGVVSKSYPNFWEDLSKAGVRPVKE